jgi:hypothetical protein
VNRAPLEVVWIRLRSALRTRLGGYLGLVLIIGVLGGLAMGSVAAARLTQSSYPTYLASTNPSDLNVSVYAPGGGPISASSSTRLTRAIRALPGVTHVRTSTVVEMAPLSKSGAAEVNTLGQVLTVGSLDGWASAQDRLTPIEGHLSNPRQVDQIELTPPAAQLLGVRVGERARFGLYSPSESTLPGFGTPQVRPGRIVDARITGIVDLNSQIVEDDVDRAYGFIFVTPALLHEAIALSAAIPQPISYGVQVQGGLPRVPAVEREIVGIIPNGAIYAIHVAFHTLGQVELAVKPESVAIGVFGVISALVCLLLAVQAIAREFRAGEEERRVLRSLGTGPLLSASDGLAPVVLAVLAGTGLGVAVAVALSPLAPLGPVRAVYPYRGVSFDWTVLGAGVAILLSVLLLAGALIAWREAPHRVRRLRERPLRVSRLVGRVEAAGLPTSGVIGARFALEPGRGRTAVPVRSALFGSVLAVVTVVATLTFASSLTTLVATPALYGWNWSYALNPTSSVPPAAMTLLEHDKDVAAFTGVQYTVVALDGQQVPVIITVPPVVHPDSSGGLDPAAAPPITQGTGLRAPKDIVVGAATLSALHKHVGDSVTLTIGNPSDGPLYVPRTRLHIVGTTTLPAVGYASFVQDHTSMGYGAMFAFAALPKTYRSTIVSADPNENGPALVFVRLRPGVSAAAGRANLETIAHTASQILARDPATVGNSVSLLGVQRPAQIVNYRSIGSTPVVLAVGLAGGAIVALGFTLYASVRRRRRDLALLKALGFAPRQLAASVAWQATVAAAIGVVAGIPLGTVAGRLLWESFARTLNAVPDPTVPILSLVLVGVGALVFANLVAAFPGRNAARTSTVEVLNAG